MKVDEKETSRFVQAGQLRIHYNEVGSGPALICLHGGGPGASSWSNYSRNVEDLSRHFRLLMIDLPGYGGSDKPKSEGPVFAFLARAVREAMAALGVESAHVIGNSLGGGTALKLALDYPQQVERLVLMGPAGGLPIFTPLPSEGIRLLAGFYDPPGPTPEKFKAFLRTMVYDKSALTDDLIAARYAAATQPGMADNFPLRFANLRRFEPLWTQLSAVRKRTLLVWGRDDRTVTLDGAFIMLNQMPDVRLHVFSQCGHWAQWEKANEFNRLVIDFLEAD